jgi:hypothetical protein
MWLAANLSEESAGWLKSIWHLFFVRVQPIDSEQGAIGLAIGILNRMGQIDEMQPRVSFCMGLDEAICFTDNRPQFQREGVGVIEM